MSYPPGGEYDERLLASIPAASRAEKQEGYNVNLLDTERVSSPIHRNPPSNLGHTNGNLETATSKEVRRYPGDDIPTKHVPRYRQRKWRIGMLIGVIIIIGAVVGGAVGGTVGRRKKSTSIHIVSTVSTTFSTPPVVTLPNTTGTTITAAGTATVGIPTGSATRAVTAV